jgi:hypothetical protein
MSKRTIGIFFLISVLMDIVGVIMIIGGLIGSTTATTNNGYATSTQVTHFGNAPLFVLGVILVSLSSIPFLIAWIGALINLARFQEWVWFVLMIIFSWITLLIYLIAGPTTRRAPQYAPYMPPQQAQNYPQQPYYNPQQPQNYAQSQQYNPESQQNYPQQPQYNQQPPQYNQQPPQYNSQQSQGYPQQDYMQQPQNNPQPPQDYPQS